MAINISAWSIRHPLPPLVMAAAIVALGWISFTKLPITRMPNVDVPVISVTITQFGAAPAELESRVTKAVEDAVSGVAGAHHINSVITDGISNTTILFRLETDTDRALNDVKDAVTSIRANLPRGIDEPMIPGRHCRSSYSHLCSDCARQDAGTTLLVRRGCSHTCAAGGSRGGAGRAHRNRRARDPGGARPGSASISQLNPARCESPASR